MNDRERKILYSMVRTMCEASCPRDKWIAVERALTMLGLECTARSEVEDFVRLGGVSLSSPELEADESPSQSLSISKAVGTFQARVAAGQKLTLGDPLAVDLSVPRVWVGAAIDVEHWFTGEDGAWHHAKGPGHLMCHEVFVAGNQPEPIINLADDMDTPLAKCDRVDW